MKRVTLLCDACMCPIEPSNGLDGFTFEYGRVGCVTAKGHLCEPCMVKAEALLKISWQQIKDANRDEEVVA